MDLEITSHYLGVLAIILIVMFVRVASMRSKTAVSIGHGSNVELHERIRQHGNFIEWTPIVIIAMAVAEIGGLPAFWLHLAGIFMVASRILLPFGLVANNHTHPLRIVGNSLSSLALIVLVAGNLVNLWIL